MKQPTRSRFFLTFLLQLVAACNRPSDSKAGAEPAASASAVVPDHSGAKVPVTSKDPTWGSATAPVTIVEISDFQCPFCSKVGPALAQVKAKYGPDKVRLVWKNNPLPFHENARPTHEAAATVFALGGNDAFFKFHDLAFANQQALTPENFEKWAGEAGVDVAKFKAAYAAKTYAAKVNEDVAMAMKVGATSTPSFRVNGVTVKGNQSFEKLSAVVDQQLKDAAALVASGTKPQDVYVALTNKNFVEPTKADPVVSEKEDKAVWNVPVLADDPIRGPKDALVTVVVFSDFQCPYCKKVEPTLTQLAEAYPNDVRFVWKDAPLPFHPRAKPAAILARQAYKAKGDAGFWAAHDALFESQPKLEDEDLQAVAGRLGLSWADAKKAIGADKYADKLQTGVDLANAVKVHGTPHFFVNGVRISGAQPLDVFKRLVDEQLVKAKALVASDVPKAKVYERLLNDAKGSADAAAKDVPLPYSAVAFMGSAGAKVSVQVFSEFQCQACKPVGPVLHELEAAYPGKVKIVWRHLPLPSHPDSFLAAQAAQEAITQRGSTGFWKMNDALFAALGSGTSLKRPAIEEAAADVGLDVAQLKAALDSGKHKVRVESDRKAATDADIKQTPAFLVNGYYLPGLPPSDELHRVIDRALSDSGS